jgi:hypothetical protein
MSTPARKLNIFYGRLTQMPCVKNACKLHTECMGTWELGQLLIQEKVGDFLKIMAGLLLGLKGQS